MLSSPSQLPSCTRKHQPLVLGDCYPVDRVEVRRQTRDARRGDPEKKVQAIDGMGLVDTPGTDRL